MCECVWWVRQLTVGKHVMYGCTIQYCGCKHPISLILAGISRPHASRRQESHAEESYPRTLVPRLLPDIDYQCIDVGVEC